MKHSIGYRSSLSRAPGLAGVSHPLSDGATNEEERVPLPLEHSLQGLTRLAQVGSPALIASELQIQPGEPSWGPAPIREAVLPHTSSEEGFSAWHTITAGELIGAQLSLPQDLIGELLTNKRHWSEPELSQRLRWPAVRSTPGGGSKIPGIPPGRILRRILFRRWLRDDQPPTLAKKGCCALGNHGGRSERSDDHPVERSSKEGIASTNFGSELDDSNAVLQVTRDHRPVKKVGAALIGVQQHEVRFWPLIGQDKTGQTSAGPEIQDARPLRAERLTPRQIDEPLCVEQMPVDGPWTQEPQFSRRGVLP